MHSTNISDRFSASIILMHILLAIAPYSSPAQGAQRVYQTMSGPVNDLAISTQQQHVQGELAPQLRRPTTPTSPLAILSTYVVTTFADTGAGSLRKAIDSANVNPDLTAISFSIGSGVQTIVLTSSLPTINYPVIIDGTTQSGFANTPIVELDGALAPPGTNGLTLIGGGSTIRGLVINRFRSFSSGANGIGIVLDVNGGNTVEGNYVGLNVAGTDSLANGGAGVGIFGTSGNNTIGGSTAQTRNVISGNRSTGVAIVTPGVAGANIVTGNYIGTNAAGTAALGNGGNGIYVDGPSTTIGGLLPELRNIISGNVLPDVFLNSGSSTIRGNYIGTDVTGHVDLAGDNNGVNIRSSNNVVGDSTEAGRNLISGHNFPSIYILGAAASGNKVLGNYIGTNAEGLDSLGDGTGLIIDAAPNNTVGGSTPGKRNVISGHFFPGIVIRNAGATGNKVQGNYIGLNKNRNAPLGNTTGIVLDNASLNSIGGATPGERNVISANSLFGIEIRNPGASQNSILGNFVGTDESGNSNLGNGGPGVAINSSQDTIGSNVIAFNHGSGISVSSGTQNLITDNSIFSNTGLGIDLAPAGLARNDSLDGDTGPNNLQNFPILDSATVIDENNVTIHGRLNSTPNSQIKIDFFENTDPNPSHFGDGRFPINPELIVTTDNAGNARFDSPIYLLYPSVDHFITATATDTAGNTSEFSQDLCLSDGDGDGIMDSWETQGWGIDVNSDSTIDLDLYALGARPNHKDLFVEIDAMTGFVPPDSALKMVQASFDSVPNIYVHNPDGQQGIKLHYQLDDTTISVRNFPNTWSEFDTVKKAYFGTKAQRDSSNKNARYILQAKNLVYRYCIFARTFGTDRDTNASGLAELANGLGGNDFMVTFGSTGPKGWFSTKALDDNAGTFMHELGHTLGLKHGGNQHTKYKPNYYSVMNYTWQTSHPWQLPGSWRLDYSPAAIPTLIEGNLDETVGLNPPAGAYLITPMPFTDSLKQIRWASLQPGTGVDWTGNGDSSSTSVSVDINLIRGGSSPGDTLTGYADWPNLKYSFRNSPDFAPGIRVSPFDEPHDELTKEINNFLDSLPPPKPYGQFQMDGQLDTSARLIASNSGISLYARYKSGQLYVATNSAQSQGADMFIFVSDALNPLRSAPSGKTGQVAAWTACLGNKSADNSSGWFDGMERSLNSITLNTAGTVLEGVIDIPFLFGRKPNQLFIAVGKYGSNAGGALLAQVPGGNGDGNIDPGELQLLGAPPASDTYFTQQGNKLVGSGAVISNVGDEQGNSVSLSSDGNTAIVGAPADNHYVGAAWVYTRSNGVWTQQGSKLVGSGATGLARQGVSVALSADGNTAIVGGFLDNSDVGAAWVYTRSNGVWTQQGNKLVGSDVHGSAHFGGAVALSADGNTAIVGGNWDNSFVGAAWVFTRTNSVWSQQGNKLVGTGSISPVSQGTSVAISSDGNTAIVGGPNDNSQIGAVWVYTRIGEVWIQQGNKLVGSSAVNVPYGAGQGISVAISSDGNTAALGGSSDDDFNGAFWVFTRSGDAWVQQGNKLVGSGAANSPYGASQGYSVALSGDGNTAIVGGFEDDGGKGATWVFTRAAGTWSQQGNKLVGTGAVNNPYPALQGYSVALSSDGNTAIVGGPNDAAQSMGAAWVFTHDSPLPIQLVGFTATYVDHAVRLNWTTLTELNNYGFEIQKSDTTQQHYQSIPNVFIPGHGTTNDPQYYSYLDSTATPGVWYYRLKQMDLNGAIHYSDGIRVNALSGVKEKEIPTVFSLYQNYPNPFNPTTTLRYDVPRVVHITLKVYNVLGQEVWTLVDRVEEPGYNAIQFNGSNLASGVYIYRLQAGDFVQARKLLLLK